MNTWIELDKHDSDMYHIYKSHKSLMSSRDMKWHICVLHEDSLEVFGKEFAQQVRKLLRDEDAERVDINLEGVIR
jgi:hypothetical protein